MENSLSILFYPKRNDVDVNGKVPVYIRLTVNGRRSEISLKRRIDPLKWNKEGGKLKGTSINVKNFNRYLHKIEETLYKHYQTLFEKNKKITAKAIKDSFLGIGEKEYMVLEVFKEHNLKVKELLGKEYAPATVKRYETTLRHISRFIKNHYKTSDFPLKGVNHEFITDFEFYFKSERNCSHNTTLKYIKNFKKIIRIGLANNWIEKDPFINYKVRIKPVKREFLTNDEIQKLINKKLHTPRLEKVRDIFIFSCYTGLAYTDIKKLKINNIVEGVDGELWIKTSRTKTGIHSNIPLLPTALRIIEKYKDDMEVKIFDILLPVLSNQKSNAYLKEIADLCKISKNLTTHLARHTFATTITLSNGVPIESVSKMLGHKSLRTTQHYAKILDIKVSNDMAILKSKLKKSSKKKHNRSGNMRIV